MTACALEAPGILEECRAIRAAEQDREWRTYVKKCREAIPALHRAAEIIETSWYDLSPEQQAEAVKVKMLVEDAAKKQAEEVKGILNRVRHTVKALWWGLNQADLMPYVYACVRFLVAVDRALANETRRRRAMDRAMASDPNLVAEIERGEADFSAGRTTRYSREEFERRFTLT